MRIHYLQHVPFEDLAYINVWNEKRKHRITRTAFYADEPLPAMSDFECLIILGGPMGVHDTEQYPWLVPEKRFIAEAIEKQKPILGICLGAQLLADVLGAAVYQHTEKEIGWYPVSRTASVKGTGLESIIPEQFHALHWHGDTFDIPQGAVHLAESQACQNQAFLYGNKILGLQFHLESDQESIEAFITNCEKELVPGPFVQEATEIRKGYNLIESSSQLMVSILNFMENASMGDMDRDYFF